MIKNIDSDYEIQYVLDNLRQEDEQELIALWGEHWKQLAFENIKSHKGTVLYGKNNMNEVVPIAIGGFCDFNIENSEFACVWLLSSVFIYNNKILFMKTLRDNITKASNKYKILYNFIYKSNFEAKNWLRKLGFRFDNPHPVNLSKRDENFEFFYKRKDM